ncbi:MAG: hypothetical protein ABL974_01045 [Prosthecobacter sp.]
MKQRIIQPELLDLLPQTDPDAVRAREEMCIVNAAMGNHGWIERVIRRHGQRGWRVTELGAGDGALSRRLLASGLFREAELQALDLAPHPADWPAACGWHCGDMLTTALPESEIVVANLFLHHFTAMQLRELGSRIAAPATRLLVAAEPARLWIYTVLGRLLCAVAELNHVQRHDMQVSIRAGFRGDELRAALGLGDEWCVKVQMHLLGGYRFIAERQGT